MRKVRQSKLDKLDEIREYLGDGTHATLTDLANALGYSKVHISKLVGILEDRDEVAHTWIAGATGRYHNLYRRAVGPPTVSVAHKINDVTRMTFEEFQMIGSFLDLTVEDFIEKFKDDSQVQEALAYMCRTLLAGMRDALAKDPVKS